MKKNFPLFLAFLCMCLNVFAQPTTNPATPPALTPAQVISVYSAAYTNVTGANFNPNWGQSGFGSATTFTVGTNEMRHYPNMNYQGIVIGSNLNLTSLDTLHLDIWSANCSSIDIFLVADGAGEKAVNVPLTLNSWNSLNIALNGYTIAPFAIPLTAIKEFKFVTVTPGAAASIYVDNIYFFTNATPPTITGFSVPAKMISDPAFTLTAPTSNSAGAFTYTSSNTAVATISGSTVTITGTGSSTITASQAANGIYRAGTAVATLVVSRPPLSTNAPTPTKPAANVISLFSDAYPNRMVDTWRTGWSGAGPLVDTAISGNNIKKYSGVDFVGIEFPAIDLTAADTMHISMWTPSAPTFSVKLVNTGGGPTNENIVYFTSTSPITKAGPAPVQGVWNVYSIPLSLFSLQNGALKLTTRNNIFQMLFVGDAPFSNNTYFIDNVYFSGQGILPVDFKGFDITKTNSTAQLSWLIASEVNVQSYEVERSFNGKDFKAIATVNATGSEKYTFTDKNLLTGINYYRIKANDKDGKFKYSATKNVTHSATKLEYSVYPNPAKNELVIKNLTGINTISLVDATGRIVLSRNNVTNGLTTLNTTSLQNGMYTVVVNNGIENKTIKVVISK